LSNEGCWKPVHVAVFKKHEEVLSYLLDEAHVDVNPVCLANKGYTPLHMCIMSPSPSMTILDMLLSHGADVNAQTAQSLNTPMHLTALMTHVNVCEKLLTVPNIDLTIKNKTGKTPLELACNYSRAIVVLICNHLGIKRIPSVIEHHRRTSTSKAPVAPPQPRDLEEAARRAQEQSKNKK